MAAWVIGDFSPGDSGFKQIGRNKLQKNWLLIQQEHNYSKIILWLFILGLIACEIS
mgnify:CR=1 FL=1